MTEIDRSNILQDLDARHDALLKDLDVLNQQVELALSAVRPSNAVERISPERAAL